MLHCLHTEEKNYNCMCKSSACQVISNKYSSGLLGLIKDFVLSVWEERKVRLYGEHANVHQSHSQNDSGDLRGVAGGDGELGCLCGKAGTSHLCDGSAHSSGCVVNGYGCRLSYYPIGADINSPVSRSPFDVWVHIFQPYEVVDWYSTPQHFLYQIQ